MADDRTPVTVLSGALGAGKTTTLNHLLTASGDRDIAVLVNDMGEVNVDAELVAESSDIADEDEELVELSNGCICCELRGDLLDAVAELTHSRVFDALVVESTGVAEPLPVAQTLTLGFDQSDLDPTEFYEETGIEPLSGCRLDTTVTVVDAHQFNTAMESDEVLDDDGTEKHLGDLLVEQVEFCDVLLLNKCDLVDEATLSEIEATLETLQPRAEIRRVTHGEVDPDLVVDTDRFDFEEAQQSAGWIRELQEPHATAEEEHGVTSFVFAAGRPFHPARFADVLDAFPDSVVRTKGHFWVAARPPEERAEQFEAYPGLEDAWDDEWGDRGTRLVCIGVGFDEPTLRDRLEACLLTDDEMDEDWATYEDRFPRFDAPEDADVDEPEGTDASSDGEPDAEEIGIAD